MARKKTSEQLPLAVAQNQRPLRQEKSLARLGYFGVSRPNSKKTNSPAIRTIDYELTDDGAHRKASAIFRAPEDLGLPTEIDQDKWFAFLEIAEEMRRRTGEEKIPSIVKFSGNQLIKKLGLAKHGEVYDDILRWGEKLAATSITSKQAVWLNSRKIYSDDTFHVFRSFGRVGTINAETGERQEQFEAHIEDWVIENLKGRYSIPLNFVPYRKLRKPIAKGIYGHLHYWFYSSGGKPVEKDYKQFCKVLDITPSRFPSKIRSTLKPSFEELISIGYIDTWDVEPRKSKDGFKVIMSPGSALLDAMSGTEKPQKKLPVTPSEMSVPDLTDQQADALRELLARNITQPAARAFVQNVDPDKILATIEFADHVVNTKRRSPNPIESPSGLLVTFLRDGTEPPPSFLSSVKRKELDKKQTEEREEFERQEQLYMEYADWVREQVDAKMDELFTPETLRERVKIVISDMRKHDPRCRLWTTEAQESSAFAAIRKEVQEDLNLPSFQVWLEGVRGKQGQLFNE